MIEIDLSADIQALRTTFANIQEVVDPEALRAQIEELERQAAEPDLWNDQANAQKVTSALSHAKAQLGKVEKVEARIDDLEVMVELAQEMDDEDTADEARAALGALSNSVNKQQLNTIQQRP